ncbi:MAG TPA: AMP-binding protein, partial [Coxiellaceae bacterium]|nr:AMP-binding protein [Coxiellaceae bacterium]
MTRDASLSKQFETIAANFPAKEAIRHSQSSINYLNLNHKANQLARYLRQQGIEQGQYVALLMDRSIEMLVALLAILKVGGIYVPLDPIYPVSRVSFCLRDCGANLLLTDREFIVDEPLNCKFINLNSISSQINTYDSGNLEISDHVDSLA